METFTDILLPLKLFVRLIYQIEMSQQIKKPWSYQIVQHSFSATNKTKIKLWSARNYEFFIYFGCLFVNTDVILI